MATETDITITARWKDKASRGLKKLIKLMGELRRLAKPLAIAFAAVAAGITAMVFQVAKFGDQLQKASIATGISVRTLSGLKIAAELAGGSFEEIVNATRFLSRAVKNLKADAVTPAVKALRQLGVDVHGKSLDEVFFDIADAMSEMTDGATRLAIAQDIFQETAFRLVPLLKQGSTEIKKQIDAAERLGLIWSQDAADAAAEFNDAITILSATFGGLFKDIVIRMLPALTSMAKALTDVVASIGGKTRAGLGDAFTAMFVKIVQGVALVATAIATMASAILSAISFIQSALPIGERATLEARTAGLRREIEVRQGDPVSALFRGFTGMAGSRSTEQLVEELAGLDRQLAALGPSAEETASNIEAMNAEIQKLIGRLLSFIGSAGKAGDETKKLGKAAFDLGGDVVVAKRELESFSDMLKSGLLGPLLFGPKKVGKDTVLGFLGVEAAGKNIIAAGIVQGISTSLTTLLVNAIASPIQSLIGALFGNTEALQAAERARRLQHLDAAAQVAALTGDFDALFRATVETLLRTFGGFIWGNPFLEATLGAVLPTDVAGLEKFRKELVLGLEAGIAAGVGDPEAVAAVIRLIQMIDAQLAALDANTRAIVDSTQAINDAFSLNRLRILAGTASVLGEQIGLPASVRERTLQAGSVALGSARAGESFTVPTLNIRFNDEDVGALILNTVADGSRSQELVLRTEDGVRITAKMASLN